MRADIVFFDAGGGHRAAANALQLASQQSGRNWDIRLVNLQETLDKMDIFRIITGIRMQDIYNHLLRRGWTLGSELLIPPMHIIIRLHHSRMVRMLTDFWKKDPPDLLVSVVPNFNRTLHEAFRKAVPNGKMVTILTDMADYPPHFWIEPRKTQEQWFICGTERATQQAIEMGHCPDRIFQTSGMILHPRFYEPITVDRTEARRKLGLRDDLPVGLVLFGGYGSSRMVDIARKVSDAKLPVQLIFICGKNEKLRRKLQSLKLDFPAFIEGFTTEVPHYMHLSDFFIGKPGPGSISEALQMNLPVIVERNSWTLPQERFNTDWVQEKKVGLVVENFDGIVQVLQDMKLDELRANAAALNNRAVFEIPEILEKIIG